jgi:hypothetical protein
VKNNYPLPPLPDHINEDDTRRKIHISQDSISFQYWGYIYNRTWTSNMTNQRIIFSKKVRKDVIWKIISSSSETLILEMEEDILQFSGEKKKVVFKKIK